MIEEAGRVVAVKDGRVWIETLRQSSCSGCAAKSGCGQGLLSSAGASRRNHICLHTSLDLTVGDEVILALPEKAFIRSSFLAYGLPLATLIAAVGVADTFLGLAEPGVIIAALLGLIAGFVLLRWLSRLGDRRGDFQPQIVRKIPLVAAGGPTPQNHEPGTETSRPGI